MEEYNDRENTSGFFKKLQQKLAVDDYARLTFDDFVEYIPFYDGGDVLDKDSISYLSSKFEEYSLESEPRIRQGYIKHHVNSPIFVYKSSGEFDHRSNSYRHGLIMVRMAVIMATADGNVDEKEVSKIKNMIWGMNILSITEKKALWQSCPLL